MSVHYVNLYIHVPGASVIDAAERRRFDILERQVKILAPSWYGTMAVVDLDAGDSTSINEIAVSTYSFDVYTMKNVKSNYIDCFANDMNFTLVYIPPPIKSEESVKASPPSSVTTRNEVASGPSSQSLANGASGPATALNDNTSVTQQVNLPPLVGSRLCWSVKNDETVKPSSNATSTTSEKVETPQSEAISVRLRTLIDFHQKEFAGKFVALALDRSDEEAMINYNMHRILLDRELNEMCHLHPYKNIHVVYIPHPTIKS